jgi:hypothetical protein
MPNKENMSKELSMKQLELRTYSREELADILNININDTNHFKRNVENKLNNWGYSYKYYKRQFEIIRVPTTANERLSEIMQRAYGMDIRIDTIAFAAFLYSLVVYPEFTAMPWQQRCVFLKEEFQVEVSDRTLRAWCSKFISSGYITKDDNSKVRWITGYANGEKYRDIIDGDPLMEQFADNYQQKKSELLKKYKSFPRKERWQMVLKELWDTYHCCIYYCKSLQFSAWNNQMDMETLQEMIELVNEIAENTPAETEYIIQQNIQMIK